MSKIDEWCAEQCGVELYTPKQINEHSQYWYDDWGNDFDYEWTIRNPRCREVVREKLDISTQRHFDRDGELIWYSEKLSTNFDAYGKTIAEAEINCIKAIYEDSNG